MSKKNITILTTIAESNLNIHEKEWMDLSAFINKEEFMNMPLCWYFKYAMLRVISTGFCEVKDIDLKEGFKENLVTLFASLSDNDRKQLFSIVMTQLNRECIADEDKTKIDVKYIENTSLENYAILRTNLFFKKYVIEERLNGNQKNIYEEVEDNLDLEVKVNQKDFFLMFNHLNNKDVLFDFKANDIGDILKFNSVVKNSMSYFRIFELEIIFLKNKSVIQNINKAQKIFEDTFESLIHDVQNKDIHLFKYDMPINFFTLMYSCSNKSDKKEASLNLLNEMFKSKREVFYEHDLLKLFYSMYSNNHLDEKDIMESALPEMINKIIDNDKRNSLSLNLVYVKRASVIYDIFHSNISLRKKLFKNLEITEFLYYKQLNGLNIKSRTGDENRKKSMYNTYKSFVFTLEELPEIYKMFEAKPYFQIDYKKNENIINDIYKESEVKANIVYKLKPEANITLIKEILFQLLISPQDNFIESAEALIDKNKMIEDIEHRDMKKDRITYKVSKF